MPDDFDRAVIIKPAYRGHSLMVFIIGMPIPAVTIWLWTQHSTGCETFINIPLLVFGILILFFSVTGIFACNPLHAVCRVRETVSVFVIFALLGYGIFILAVSSPGGGRFLPPGIYFQDYVLEDYSHWMQNRVNNTRHWDRLKGCLVKKNVCRKFFDEYVNDTEQQFLARHLSSIESGCCKPPTNCNFNYTSAIKWTKPKERNQTNTDCNVWNEDGDIRCLNCRSCKAGFVNDVKSNWVVVGIVIVVVLSLIIFVFRCASCMEWV